MELDDFELKRTLGLTDPQIAVLRAMLERRAVTALEIEEMGSASSAVTIYRMRAKLEPYGIFIHSMPRLGYWLDEPSKQALASAVGATYAPAV